MHYVAYFCLVKGFFFWFDWHLIYNHHRRHHHKSPAPTSSLNRKRSVTLLLFMGNGCSYRSMHRAKEDQQNCDHTTHQRVADDGCWAIFSNVKVIDFSGWCTCTWTAPFIQSSRMNKFFFGCIIFTVVGWKSTIKNRFATCSIRHSESAWIVFFFLACCSCCLVCIVCILFCFLFVTR